MYSRLFELLVEGKTTGSDPVATGRRVAKGMFKSWNINSYKNSNRVRSISDKMFKRNNTEGQSSLIAHKKVRDFGKALNKRKRDIRRSEDALTKRLDSPGAEEYAETGKTKDPHVMAWVKGNRTK